MPYADEEQPFERAITPLLGLDTASAPTTLAPGRWRYQINAYQGKIGADTKRPGSVPVTNTPLGAVIKRLTVYRSGVNEKILAFAGTSGYKYAAGAWTPLTGSVANADVFDTDFTYAVNRKLIADTGALKEYDDTIETIVAVAPDTDDTSPAPPNALANINAKGIKYIFPYNGYIWLSDGSDTWWYTKRYTYNYVPSTHEVRWLKENDYMTGPGVLFDNVVLLPMRHRWGIMVPTADPEVFDGNQFLNTTDGNIAPRSISRVTFPDGTQTVFYLSDSGVCEIYDTGYQDQGSRRYSTRNRMANRIDFDAMGFTDAEKQAAAGHYDVKYYMYFLSIKRASTNYTYCYDVRTGEWYLWTGAKTGHFLRSSELYFAGETGHLHKFDTTLGRDWNEATKTTGVEVDWDNIMDVTAFEDTGYPSYLDYLTVLSKTHNVPSSIDVYVRTFYSTLEIDKAIQNQSMVWGAGQWGTAVWYNVDLSDLVSKPKRIVLKKRSPFFQIRFRNNRDEPAEMYSLKLSGRTSGG